MPSASAAPDNGVAALEPRAVLARTIAALKGERSYFYDGCHFNLDPDVCAKIDIVGKDFTGTMTMGEGRADVRYVGGRSFLRADLAFWRVLFTDDTAFDRAAATTAAALNDTGRWIEMPSAYRILGADFGGASIWTELQAAEVVHRIGPLQLEGQGPSVVIGIGSEGRVFVAMTGKPYPIRISTERTTAMLSRFGAAAAVKAPPAADVVALNDLFKKRDTIRA
ncbi:hypothetical protein Aph02nite_12890 [Actinoplanes philippinensis]|uniref:DUF2092 domain-containing protein n=2 Tax=Actinoplanes philippinensis TaxID=35752 RepID=A0A1I1ZQZ3_9ACTN|nr:hypothetical protein [Actinoplanes philippinensis]GIE75339.1 hypothetical protein Aph02nite_12890 [Actinoplanes philippinensis]SFE34117.1 hypothetical protein SAMN05421541_101250 [Actinoplanes philippinensis]